MKSQKPTRKFLRRKGRWGDGEAKYVIEEMSEGKSKYLETVPRVDEVIRLIRQDKLSHNPSQINAQSEAEVLQKGVYSLLSEQNKETKIKTVSEEEKRILAEMSK